MRFCFAENYPPVTSCIGVWVIIFWRICDCSTMSTDGRIPNDILYVEAGELAPRISNTDNCKRDVKAKVPAPRCYFTLNITFL